MAKYIYNTPEHVRFVRRDKKGNIKIEINVSTFHNGYGVDIDGREVHQIHNLQPTHSSLQNLDLDDIKWLLDVLSDVEKFLEMKAEDNEQ